MQIKNLFLLACLLASTLAWGNNNPVSIVPQSIVPADGGACNIPPPPNFHIEEVGTTWIKYSWNNVSTYKHRVRTYRASDNLLLNTTIVLGGISSCVAQPLPPGTPCYGVINVICTDDSNSGYEGTSEIKSTLIIDLVADGLSIPNGGPTCTLTGTGTCMLTVPNGTTPFKISTSDNLASRQFGLRKNDSNNPYPYTVVALLADQGGNNPFWFKCPNGVAPCGGPEVIEVWYPAIGASAKIATITANQGGNWAVLQYNQIISGYKIDRTDGAGGLPPGHPSDATDRDGNSSGALQQAIASPNPFAEVLDVFLGQNIVEKVNLQLFNLSGQKVIAQAFEGGQEQYSLPTSGLSPGFYMLRIEADGVVQTLKVIKSE